MLQSDPSDYCMSNYTIHDFVSFVSASTFDNLCDFFNPIFIERVPLKMDQFGSYSNLICLLSRKVYVPNLVQIASKKKINNRYYSVSSDTDGKTPGLPKRFVSCAHRFVEGLRQSPS